MYDYIIVGAGIYGKLMAYLLSIKKNKILLIDKKEINKKIKTENIVITKETYQLLNELLNFDIESFIVKKIHSIVINGKKVKKENIIFNSKKLEEKLILEYKRNKGKILDRVKISSYNFKNNYLVILGKKYHYKKMIGADGTLSEVRMNITKKIQKFKFLIQFKTKMGVKEIRINFNNRKKTLEHIIPLRSINLIKINNISKKNKVLTSLNILKEKYQLASKNINGYFIPDNDLLFKSNNIYFIGDASGIIDPITYHSFSINLIYIKKLISHLNDQTQMNYNNIKKQIILKKMASHILFLPLLNELFLKVLIKKYSDDLC